MRRVGLCVGAVALLLAGGCSVSPGDKVSVGLEEWKIDIKPASVRSGRVQFEIDNDGELTHDLVLIHKADPSQLALTPEGGVDLAVDRPIDEIKDLEPGSYLAASPNVLAGEYLVVCTITKGADGQPQNHFQAGMWAKLKVVPKTRPDREPPTP
jgi:uncharacterized cupredoxin-like copper-binding protein